jgi:hypothetical protein
MPVEEAVDAKVSDHLALSGDAAFRHALRPDAQRALNVMPDLLSS